MIITVVLSVLLFREVDFNSLPMNYIQVIGTHNSYHLKADYLNEWLDKFTAFKVLDYEHSPLDVQLRNGIRNFELDVHLHRENGWIFMHIPHIDPNTLCYHFKDCLKVIKNWSDEYPGHVPICIILDAFSIGVYISSEMKKPTKEDLISLENEILEVLGREKVLTPDDVRGEFTTLEEAITKKGWPLLSQVRGKFYFVLHTSASMIIAYVRGNMALEGRVMFVNSRPGVPYAGIMIVDNPYCSEIPNWVKRGYIVKVFGGDPNIWGLEVSKKMDEIAFKSGAQIIATDFPVCNPHPETGYFLKFPQGCIIRGNPIFNLDRYCAPEE